MTLVHSSTLKLLIIEDDPVDREAYKRYLDQDGLHKYEFLESETVEDGLRTLRSEHPDCVLLDYQLPDGTGLELLEALQEESEHFPSPVVMLTGQGNDAIEISVVQRGVQDYLVKGEIDPQALVRAVWHAIERHRMIGELHRAKQEAQRLATHCSLTNLPNRYLFSDRLSKALATAERNENGLAVLFVDLDRFKSINDTLGHDTGDEVLKIVAERMLARLRAADTVARLGGDEFVVILTTLKETVDAARVAQSLLCTLSEVIVVDGQELYVDASIGIAVHPNDGDTSETLIRNADAAMYRAKERGGGNHQFYASDMHRSSLKKLSMEQLLRKAVERDELVLHFQPKVDGETGRIIGGEALVRWRQPEIGFVAPGDFIPLAEETGLIIGIGEWVLREACRQLRAWWQAGLPRVPISVNVSAHQLSREGFAQLITGILRDYDTNGADLELEVTESCLIRDLDATIRTLNSIKALGIKISVDDFGTGYSSLSVINRLPLDTLKIDRAFIDEVASGGSDAMVTLAIIALARSLGLDTLAEGVETREQREFLLEHGCRAMQGFLFSPPVPTHEFESMLAAGSIALKESECA